MNGGSIVHVGSLVNRVTNKVQPAAADILFSASVFRASREGEYSSSASQLGLVLLPDLKGSSCDGASGFPKGDLPRGCLRIQTDLQPLFYKWTKCLWHTVQDA